MALLIKNGLILSNLQYYSKKEGGFMAVAGIFLIVPKP
jgi:hypothetical protein